MKLRLMRCWPVILLSACAAGSSPPADAEPAGAPVSLFAVVSNQNSFDALIYAYRNGQWTRIGGVRAGETSTLPFTWDQRQVRFVIELLGNDEITDRGPEQDGRKTFAADVHGTVPCHLTGPSDVEPNLMISLTVVADLERSAGRSRCQPRR